MSKVSRRGFLQGAALAAGTPQSAKSATQDHLHRTQFDAQLLAESYDPLVAANHGRQMSVRPNGDIRTALAWNGNKPRVLVYNNRDVVEEFSLSGVPSPPVLAGEHVWYSAGTTIFRGRDRHAGIEGTLVDAAMASDGSTWLAVNAGGRLGLAMVGARAPKLIPVDDGAGRASLEFDSTGALHVAYEKRQGIEYRIYERGVLRYSERAAEAYGFHPVLLAHKHGLLLVYLGESCRLPSARRHSEAFERLGRGGYIAALMRQDGKWKRCRLADSRQLVKALYPTDAAYTGGDTEPLITHLEEFSPPAAGIGGDGVVQVLWSDNERRWIYGARLLGDEFAPAHEFRGPIEQVTGPCLIPKNAGGNGQANPLAMVTRTRVYLDRIVLPATEMSSGGRIDFVTPDELTYCSGLEFRVNQMQRRAENPVIPLDPPGGTYDSAIVPNVFHDRSGWRAELMYIVASKAYPNTADRGWRHDGLAISDDGIHWKKLAPEPLEQRFRGAASAFTVRFVEDPQERDPSRRFKGLMRSPEQEPWGYVPMISPDGVNWARVPNPRTIVRADDDLRVWIDPHDVPARRFKANAIGRSFCGRIAVQFTSPDGIEWNDERDTLDFQDPFRAHPDRGSTGRILLDSWSGPEDEDEIHGGFVFHEGSRWLLHYMKWTADGHIYAGLAASRDGLNFCRVGGGAVTLPLGEPGTWDAGRVALREAPFRIDNVWRQYYTGSGWKHGLGGVGAKTSHFGLNAPNQVGAAEIPVGHWAHLQTRREVDEGEMTTRLVRLARPHSLKVDVEGKALRIAVIDPSSGREAPGFSDAEFDPLPDSGVATWRGHGLEILGARAIQVRVRIAGSRVKLFGLELV